MPYPTPIIEIAFDDGPYVASPTWTDVTAYVRSMETSRGVPDDWTLQADGSASVTLSNRDRRFDPFNTSGPYYGKLLPRRQIRIRATSGGTTYDVFRGFISGWPPEWTDAGKDSTVTLSCFDALQLLGSESLPADWSRNYILSTSPRHYWPCDEPITPYGSGVVNDFGSYPQNMTTTSLATPGSQLAVGLVNNSIRGTAGVSAASAYGAVFGATSFSVSMWAILDPDRGDCTGEIGNCNWTVGYTSATSRYNVLIVDGSSGVYRQFTTTSNYENGDARMISFSFNQSTKAFALYLDGVLAPTSVVTGAQIYIPLGEQTQIGSGQVQQLIIWTSVVSQATIQEVYRYSTVNLPETTAARFTRLMATSSFPASLTSGPSSPASSVLDITDNAPTLSSELTKLSNSEFAPLFVNKAGTLTLYNQNQIRTQTRSIVSQVNYGNPVGLTYIPMGPDVQIQYDGDSMRNVANIEMSGGGVYIQNKTSSVSVYGEAEQYVSTQVSTYTDAQDIANIVTGWGGQVYPKMSPASVVLSPSGTWGSTLGLELFDRISFTVQPPEYSAISYYYLVSRVSHSVTPERWTTTLEGSARWAAVFILNQSTLGGADLLG